MPRPCPLSSLLVLAALGCQPASDAPPRAEAKANEAAPSKEAVPSVPAPTPTPAPETKAEVEAPTRLAPEGETAPDEGETAEATPDPTPPSKSPDEIRIVTRQDESQTFQADDGSSCTPEMFASAGLPAVRGDGERIAAITIEGPANGDDLSFDYAIAWFDRSGATVETLELWTPARIDSVPDAAACRKSNEDFRALVAKANARFSTGGWTRMERLAAHIDLVHDLEVPAESCRGKALPTTTPSADTLPPVVTCDNKPRVLEAALVGGPTLALRVPGVKVWHRQPAKGLRIPITDTWEKGMCSSAPVVDDAWRSPEHRLVLLRFDGADAMMDACGYRRLHGVLDLPELELPELSWSRSPSPVDLMIAGEELELP